jgi:hypothetical protein
VLAVDRSQNNPDDLFEQAQSAEEAGNIAEAERLYRTLMKSDPTDASAPFNLGNLLRASARNVEAEAALRAATCVDPTFADAWYNLSDLLDEQGRSDAAIECLRTALRVIHRCNVQSRAAIATNKPICRGGRLLATLSRQRLSIGMGCAGASIIEILRDTDQLDCLCLTRIAGDTGLLIRQKGQSYWSRSISPLISSERPIPPSVTVASAGSLSLPLSLPSAKPCRTAFSISRWAVTPNLLRNLRMLVLKTSSFIFISMRLAAGLSSKLRMSRRTVDALIRDRGASPHLPSILTKVLEKICLKGVGAVEQNGNQLLTTT